MQFTAKTDIEAPAGYVFATLTDFEGWERAAMRRGAEVARTDKLRSVAPGMSWDMQFRFRGRERKLALQLAAMEPGTKLNFTGRGKLIDGDMALDVVALGPSRTRLVMELEIRPLTLGARLMLQSLKLARGRVQGRLNMRMTQLAKEIEVRHASARGR